MVLSGAVCVQCTNTNTKNNVFGVILLANIDYDLMNRVITCDRYRANRSVMIVTCVLGLTCVLGFFWLADGPECQSMSGYRKGKRWP
jgi:hypothetical protein